MTTPSHSAIRPWLLVLCALSASACATSRARSRDADVARVRLAVAADRARHRDWPAALNALDPLPKEGGARAAALTLRGTVFREKGLLEEAEADLKDALSLRSDAAATHAALAVVYDLRSDLERGATHHARAVELEPENAGYLNDLAFSLFVRGKAREAIPVYQRALRVAPEDQRIRNNLGFALARAGEFSRATQQFALGGIAGAGEEQPGLRLRASRKPVAGLRPVPRRDAARPDAAPGAREPASRRGHAAAEDPARRRGRRGTVMKSRWSRALALALVASRRDRLRARTAATGESVRAALRAQAAPAKKHTNAVEGLDSQEAAIIARTYHQSLAPKGEKAPDENVILVAPTPAGGARPQALAPSVPNER